MEASQEQKEEITLRSNGANEESIRKRQPFNFGIKELKRVLDRMDMPKAERNKTIRLYKQRLYTRVDEVKKRMESELLPDEDNKDATDK